MRGNLLEVELSAPNVFLSYTSGSMGRWCRGARLFLSHMDLWSLAQLLPADCGAFASSLRDAEEEWKGERGRASVLVAVQSVRTCSTSVF